MLLAGGEALRAAPRLSPGGLGAGAGCGGSIENPIVLKGVGPSPLSPKGDSCWDSQDTGASNQEVTGRHKGWRKGQILALISADLFCTVTE